jgi:AbiV family abortive infection protein
VTEHAQRSRRLGRKSLQRYARFSIEAARNAGVLLDVAAAAARQQAHGLAVALSVLALEEAAKAQGLGMMVWASTLDPGIAYPTAGLKDVALRRDHTVRHRFAAWQKTMQAIVQIYGERRDLVRARKELELELEAARRVASQTKWLHRADRLKQQGLYVELPANTMPIELTRADYDEALAIIEPYVTLTRRQAGLIPKPGTARRRVPFDFGVQM